MEENKIGNEQKNIQDNLKSEAKTYKEIFIRKVKSIIVEIDNKLDIVERYKVPKKAVYYGLAGIVAIGFIGCTYSNVQNNKEKKVIQMANNHMKDVYNTYKLVEQYYNDITEVWKDAKDKKLNQPLIVKEKVKDSMQLEDTIRNSMHNIEKNKGNILNNIGEEHRDMAELLLNSLNGLYEVAINPMGYKDLKEYEFNWNEHIEDYLGCERYFSGR